MTFIPNYDFFLRVARGLVPGHSILNKFGRNADVDTGPEDIWGGGGLYTGQPTGSPETVEIFSGDANDTSAGTGLQTARITGLKASTSTAYETEDLTMNGVTAVTSASTWYRVFSVKGLTYGSGGTNAGIITVRHTTTTANIFAQMPIGKGRTQICAFTIPDAVTGYVIGLTINMAKSGGAAGSAEITIRMRDFGTGGYNVQRNYEITHEAGQGGFLALPIVLLAKCDVIMRVESVASTNTIVTAEFDVILIDD